MARNATASRGFSLLELVCVLVLLGLLAVVATVGLTRSVGQYHFARDNDALAQKAHIALRRIVIELSHLDTSSQTPLAFASAATPAGQPRSYAYTTVYDGVSQLDTLAYQPDSGVLTWNGYPLCDRVTGFAMTADPAGATGQTLDTVAVTLTVTGDNGVSRSFAATFAVKGRVAE